MLTFGIEEEFVFLDPATLAPAHVAPDIKRELLAAGCDPAVLHHELFKSQLEFVSPIFDSGEVAATSLRDFRTALLAAASARDVLVAGVGAPFQKSQDPVMSNDNRYDIIAEYVGALSTEHEINGLHVHVGIPDPDSGIAALNEVRRWLPTLLAISANSPFWCGRDTSFASWRAIQSRRWTTAGCPPEFSNAADYKTRVEMLVGIGGTPDPGTIAWFARLSEHQPTLEIRAADAQLQPWMSVMLALICRGLVGTYLDPARERHRAPAPELLDASLWHAARHGLGARLVHPIHGHLVPAAEAVHALMSEIAPALEASGDGAAVAAMTHTLLSEGSGAQQQRQCFVSGGLAGLAELYTGTVAGAGGSTDEAVANPAPQF